MKCITDMGKYRKNLEDMLTDRIHYGCGKNILAGWLNVDGFDESYPDGAIESGIAENIFCCNLADRHPFPENYFRFGFCEDFIEHMDQADSLIFLEEAYRTFAPGGVLRLSFPGFENVLKKHFNRADFDTFAAAKRDAYSMWTHKHFYCKEALSIAARHIGFREIRFVDYGISDYSELNGLDTRPEQKNLNIYAELSK